MHSEAQIEGAKRAIRALHVEDRRKLAGLLRQQPEFTECLHSYNRLVEQGLAVTRIGEVRSKSLGIVDYRFYDVPEHVAKALRQLHGEE